MGGEHPHGDAGPRAEGSRARQDGPVCRETVTLLGTAARALKITRGSFLEFSLYDFQAVVDHGDLKPQKVKLRPRGGHCTDKSGLFRRQNTSGSQAHWIPQTFQLRGNLQRQ